MLVDALASGRQFWPCRLRLSEEGSIGKIMFEIDEAKNSGNLEKMKATLAKAKEQVDKVFSNFDLEKAKEVLQIPRFYMNSPFLKSDIPFSEWQAYARTLPALAIPFREFWFEWEWEDDDRLVSFAAKISTEYKPHEPCTMQLDIFIDIPSKSVEDGRQTVVMIDGTVEIDEDRKVKSVNTHENDMILFLPILHSLALLNCKNVITAEVPVPRQIKRQIMRRLGIEMYAYHVVRIAHSKRRARKGEDMEEVEHEHASRPLSICRGHFKTYDDRGLFGNKFGTWWWQDHVRGDEEQGVVVKDYAMSK